MACFPHLILFYRAFFCRSQHCERACLFPDFFAAFEFLYFETQQTVLVESHACPCSLAVLSYFGPYVWPGATGRTSISVRISESDGANFCRAFFHPLLWF